MVAATNAIPGRTPVQYGVADTFEVPVDPTLRVEGFSAPAPYTPDRKPVYVFEVSTLARLLAWMEVGQGTAAWLYGFPGTGKTTLPTELAARLNLELVEVNCHNDMEIADILGGYQVVGGTSYWHDGPAMMAYRQGMVLLFNEVDTLQPGVFAGLNDLFLGNPYVLPNGERVVPAPGYRPIVTANTSGGGDATGLMAGTMRQNAASRDRFTFIRVDYPAEAVEQKILELEVPTLPESIRNTMVKCANEVRALFMGVSDADGALDITISTRGLVRWARYTNFLAQGGADGLDALKKGAKLSFPIEDDEAARLTIEGAVDRLFGSSTT